MRRPRRGRAARRSRPYPLSNVLLRLCIFNVYDLPVPALTRANNLRLASTAGGCLHNGQGIAKLHALARNASGCALADAVPQRFRAFNT